MNTLITSQSTMDQSTTKLSNIGPPNNTESITDTSDARLKLEQAQHRLQRAENRKNYLADTQRKQRAHRLITRGAAMEHIFPDIVPLTEREFFELTERISELPGTPALIQEAVDRHHDIDNESEREAS